ncbi:class I SAM-dependent methyltransferase [Exilibacterium tricleocarpae]|uniref:Class I SAM-dependent methyltransferase n=1 Tax=Exilibacterium tricleocarpae TaxID=2591008 RepID=A0A545SS30_9GAMM|nr:class I SAM-dependent methyltransferase [Exilibacterium tricleocarpae]TQV67773.1 class I SAM-dependent methyltransferase [Exilibacterium tricleocarpae]
MKSVSFVVVLALLCWASALRAEVEVTNYKSAVEGEHRTAAYAQRDEYRNPAATLAFFGVAPDMSVVEIWPGGGWYSEILAPLLRENGTFYAAHFPVETEVGYFQRVRKNYAQKLAAAPALYDKVVVTEFHPPSGVSAGPAGKVDRVLTFRNVHNWMKAGYDQRAFDEFFALLKPGGVLGVVEHRARPGTDKAAMGASGYVTEAYVIARAEAAGFVLEAKSEVNANPRDSAQHPQGVWTLPPSLRLGETDRDKYLAIGESDRMTLKFRRPADVDSR